MRCQICDAELTIYESTLKDKETKEYYDTCKSCLNGYVYNNDYGDDYDTINLINDKLGLDK
jgi:hypothetical protein